MTLDLIKIRRDLHQIPEIGLEEFETQALSLGPNRRDHRRQRLCRATDLADRDPGVSPWGCT